MIQETVPSRHHHHQHDVGSVDGLGFQIATPNATTYAIGYDWPYAGKIAQLRMTCDLGQGQVSVLINGNVVTGLDHVPVSAGTRSEISASDLNSFNPGDDLILRVDSGVPSLINLRGTLVVSNRTIFSRLVDNAPGFTFNQLPITAALAGKTVIPVTFNPPLLRNPPYIFAPVFILNTPTDPLVFSEHIFPLSPGNFMQGWNYYLNSPASLGQIMLYAYLL